MEHAPNENLPVPVKKRGRPPQKPERPQSQSLLPVLDVDFNKDPADLVLPCHPSQQAKHLGWYVPEVKSVNRTLGLYDQLPMICKGHECYWAEQCPTAPTFLFATPPRRCPLEIIDIWRYFAGYIRELGVSPDDHVDLNIIADLVRIDLAMKRLDRQLQLEGNLLVDTVGGIIQGQNGKAVYEKTTHPILQAQEKLRRDRSKLYDQLLVSRKEKKRIEQAEGRNQASVQVVLSRLAQAIKASRQEGSLPVLPAMHVDEVLNAEVLDDTIDADEFDDQDE